LIESVLWGWYIALLFGRYLQPYCAEDGMNADVDARDSGGRPPEERPFWSSPAGLVTLGFLGVAGFFLITEHTAHVLGALPWLLLAACPLMHLFMHHGHGGHRHGGAAPPPGDGKDAP
jgi:hypothetical protein